MINTKAIVVPALVLIAMPVLAETKSAGTPTKSERQRTDFENGVRQLKAQSDGKMYGDPIRQRALDDAVNSGSASSDTTKSSPTPKKANTGAKAKQQ